MREEIKASIIIPVYNGETFIIETLETCNKQNYKNLEIIIIDDFSTDNSCNLVKEYIKDKNKFKFFKNTKVRHVL